MANFVFTEELRNYYLAQPGSSEERVNRLKEAIEKKSDKFKITKQIKDTGLEDRISLVDLEKKLGISEPGKEGEATTVSAAPVRLSPMQKIDKAVKDIKVAIGRLNIDDVDVVEPLLKDLETALENRAIDLTDEDAVKAKRQEVDKAEERFRKREERMKEKK